MTLNQIVASLKAYDDIITDSAALVDFFEQGNCYIFELPAYANGSEKMHAYPGIFEEKLFFFMIPAHYDRAATTDIAHYVTVCPVLWNLKNGHLPNREAQAIIDRWGNDFRAWIPDQVANSPYGMFKAFAIPMADFEVEQTQVNLALRVDVAEPTGYGADMVVTNIEDSAVYYNDFAEVVPPFTASASSNSFYLLSLV